MHRYTQENYSSGYMTSSSSVSVPTLCSIVSPIQQTVSGHLTFHTTHMNIRNNVTLTTIQPLATISQNAQVRLAVNTINVSPAGDATPRQQSMVTPQGSEDIPSLKPIHSPNPPSSSSHGKVQTENTDTNTSNEPCSSTQRNKKGKRGKAKVKIKDGQNKKQERKEATDAENAEIRAFLDYNYLGRSEEENLVCYICSDRFDERVQLKNHIVNLHLRHIPIKAFSVCPLCSLVCRSRNQFVDHALKPPNRSKVCKTLILRSKEKQAEKSKQLDKSE